MSQQDDLPSVETVRAVLDMIAPNFLAFNIQPLAGSYSNYTHLVNVEFPDSPTQRMVFRRYNEANENCAVKARREFAALKLLRGQGFPAPTPLYLDDAGILLGSPGIITEFVHGEQIEAAAEPEKWASKYEVVARMPARIHATAYDDITRQVLMNGNVETVWFLKSGTVPDFMQRHPDGEAVWQTVAALFLSIRPVKPVFLHTDYWSGNILWDQDHISAVVDWEEAAYGDPGADVAYCLMELYLEGLDDAAAKFLQVYEQAAGQQVANLGFWELAAATRPMIDLDSWLTRPHMDERFRRFIASAQARAFRLI